jgi:hypothetical protein
MLVDRKHVVDLGHHLLKFSKLTGIVILHLIDLAQLAQAFEELISGSAFLTFEERKPEDLGVHVRQSSDDIIDQVVVHNVFEIDGVEFVGPWVKYLEALMVHVLISETLDVLLDEVEVGLVGLDGVIQVVLIDVLLSVSQERSNCLDARRTLKVLGGQKLVQMLLEVLASSIAVDFQHLKNAHKDLLESLQVPVLVNDCVDNA